MKRLHFFIFLMSFVYICKAQNTFQKLVYTEFPLVRFTKILPVDSSHYMMGTFVDTVSPLRTGVMFMKLDNSFEFEILNTIKHPGKLYFDDFGHIVQTGDGNFLTLATVLDNIARALLIGYSPAGDTLFTREYKSIRYPGWNYLVSQEIRQRPGGGYGIYMGHQEEEHGQFDLSLLTLDSDYNVQSYTDYGIPHLQETATSMLLDDDGGYLLGADRSNETLVDEGFNSRTYIVKTDSVGNVLWEYLSPPGKLQAEAKAMVKSPDGGLIVATGIGTETPSNPAFHLLKWDAMIFKLDANRNVVWETPFRGVRPWTQSRLVKVVEALDSSGYVAIGKVLTEPEGSEAMSETWLIKVSPQGDSLWARYYTYIDGIDVDPEPYDLKATLDGGYIVVGSAPRLGNPVPGWILKVDEHGCLVPGCHLQDDTTSVSGGLPMASLELAVFPNPVSDLLNFELRNGRALQKANFRILDAAGRTVRTFQSGRPGSTFVLNVSNWPEGIYFLQYIEDGAVIFSKKFIKH